MALPPWWPPSLVAALPRGRPPRGRPPSHLPHSTRGSEMRSPGGCSSSPWAERLPLRMHLLRLTQKSASELLLFRAAANRRTTSACRGCAALPACARDDTCVPRSVTAVTQKYVNAALRPRQGGTGGLRRPPSQGRTSAIIVDERGAPPPPPPPPLGLWRALVLITRDRWCFLMAKSAV